MKHLEDELRTALRREEPSPDFTARVLERVMAETAATEANSATPDNVAQMPLRRQSPAWRRNLAAAAAVAIVAIGASWVTLPGQDPLSSKGVGIAPDNIMVPVPTSNSDGPKGELPQTPTPPVPDVAGPSHPRRTATRKRVVEPAEPTPEEIHAAEQLALALKITQAKLSTVQTQVTRNLSEPRS